jgi:nucleotide-binding universal stress UspA family protein
MIRIVIAVDGSDCARRALEAAGRLAREAAVDAVLLNVREEPVQLGDLPPYDDAAATAARAEQQRWVLEAAQAQALQCGLAQVITQAEVGAPAREIARVAKERNADLIVMGTRGMNALGGLLLGSVAQRVVHLAHVPVMLVK